MMTSAEQILKRMIREKCLQCSGNSVKEVRGCLVKDCALYPARMGADLETVPKMPKEYQVDYGKQIGILELMEG